MFTPSVLPSAYLFVSLTKCSHIFSSKRRLKKSNGLQYFNDSDADEEFEGFDEFDIAENIEIVGGIDIEQAENDRDIRDDVEVGWTREDAVPLIAPFLYLSCHTTLHC
jgi:hypothetical protein